MSIFKAYDIRGVYPDQLNEDTAYKVGRAFAELLRKELASFDTAKIVVGKDMRTSGDSLTAEVIRGVREGGLNVVFVGLVSTPTFYYAVATYGYQGGLMVSASHNPAQYNGFKMVREHAVPVSGDTGIKEIEQMVEANVFPASASTGGYEEHLGILQEQVTDELAYGNPQAIKPLKVVADAANGMGILYLEELFKQLPCELIKMNFTLDGTFPAHEADPLKDENNADLKKRVLEEKADLGIATDGDGDRIFFIDNEGQLVEPAIVRGIMARVFLREKPGSKIAYDIRPGKITRDMIEEGGGIPIITKVGHSLIKEQALKEGAYFAGESSGHFFLNMPQGCYEVPMIVTLKLLQELSESGQSLADYVRPLKRYAHSGEINTKVTSVAEVLEAVKQKYADGQQNHLDGVTVEYPDYWFNVRGSNTEPLVRLNLEAKTPELMAQKRDEVMSLIMSYQIKA